MTTIAALELALIMLPKITVGVTQFVAYIATLKSALQQSGEWTDAFEQQWRAALLSQGLRPEEIPDAG